MTTKRISRRDFMARASATVVASTLAGSVPGLMPVAYAGPSPGGGRNKLVVIYLRGGADALNILIPHGDDFYYEYRPEIAVPREGGKDVEGVVELDDVFGLHPSLGPLMPLWKAKKLAPVVCVGSPHPTRSHFDAQDFMEYAAPGLRTVRDGWLNRYLAASATQGSRSGLRALAMQRLLPRSLRGRYPVLAVPQRPRREVTGVLDEFEELYGGKKKDEAGADPMMGRREDESGSVKVGRDTIATLRELYEIFDGDDEKPSGVRYPRGFGRSLEKIARVIKADAGLEVACMDVGGWDTHANQGGAAGNMARRMAALAGSLAAFAKDLGPHLERTLVVVMTEFGRTCRENGNRGTDHGHGGCMLLLGGQVRGGRVLGDWPGLDDKQLYQARDLQVTTDFRCVFDSVLRGHLGFEPPRGFFPDFSLPRKRPELFA